MAAGLLAYGRAVVGAAEIDPPPDVLLVAYHTMSGSSAAPWPVWCQSGEEAQRAAHAFPHAARLVYLAAQCQATGPSGTDPLTTNAADALLPAFNDFSPVRQWLDTLHEVRAIPGLLENIRVRGAVPDPTAEYKFRRTAFLDHCNRGLQFKDRAAYHHRQDQYLSKQPAAKELLRLLQENRPHNETRGQHPDIETFLALSPEGVVSAWVASTGGSVILKGNQRGNLRKQAEDYLRLASAAWQAARTAVQSRPRKSDVDDYRARLHGTLSAAQQRAQGQPWGHLFERLITEVCA